MKTEEGSEGVNERQKEQIVTDISILRNKETKKAGERMGEKDGDKRIIRREVREREREREREGEIG